MKQQNNTVTVNGQLYDTKTGLQLPPQSSGISNGSAETRRSQPTTAHTLHSPQRKSTTLRRSSVKKQPPTSQPQKKGVSPDIMPRKRPGSAAKATPRSAVIKKYSPQTKQQHTETTDIKPRSHPHEVRARQVRRTATKPAGPRQSAKEIKEAEIAKALRNAKPTTSHPTQKKKHTKLVRIGSISAIVVLIAAAALWINLPKLSVTIASAQSGVAATIPHFRPDGYSLQIPITAEENKVIITFASNQNDTSFTLAQEKSSWDSQAVRELVEKRSSGQFLTTNDRGLTIYTYNGSAAWVNKGILYTIAGDSYLSNDTILRIANSL